MINTGRPRGILTESDRNLIGLTQGERLEKHSRPNLSQRRTKIQERVRNGILDLPHLYRNFPRSWREEVFGGIAEDYTPWTPSTIIRESSAFLLVGFFEQSNFEFDDEEIYADTFERAINATLSEVSTGASEIDVDVTVRGWRSEEDFFKSRDLSRYDRNTLRNMLNSGWITDEEYARAILDEE